MFNTAYKDTVYIKQQTGVDGGGKPSYGLEAKVKARVQRSQEVVITSTGEEKVSAYIIYLDEEVNTTDKLWPEGAPDDSQGYRPLLIERSGAIGVNTQLTKVTI